MTPTISPTSSVLRSRRSQASRSPRDKRAHAQCGRGERRKRPVLARYTDPNGRAREVVAQRGSAGSVLVVDRDAATRGDRRLVAHVAADEPPGNTALECSRYLEETRGRGCRCRPLTPEDAQTVPFAEIEEAEPSAMSLTPDADILDRLDRSYRLELLRTQMSIPELRWRSHRPSGAHDEWHPVSVREVIACLESYEPVRTLTLRALALRADDGDVSTTVLREELERLQESPIVLNRKLRTVVLATIERQGLSMSEIAIRCGRVKRDRSGNESGETSWLARRLGMLPEAGRNAPTPWIHSDVLALIARRGLGLSPREVEL